MADVIGNPTIRAEFDGTALVKGAKDAGAKLKTTFEESNRNVEAVQRKATQRIQGLISSLNAEKPRRQMFELGQAVQQMGGQAKLTEGQISRLRTQVERLAAAGAKVPSSLSGLTGGSKVGAAFTSLTTGGGVSGALAALGPAGVLAAGGLGVATVATMKMANAVKELAGQAEQWSNVSEATGISVESVQKLGDFLEDAGFQADDLSIIMKKLQVEIATGGKGFEAFGISLATIKGLAPEEQLRAMAAAVMAIVDPTERAAAATEFFGKQGAAKIAALRGIADGTYTQLHALNLQQIADLKRVDEQLDEAGRAWTNWSKRALVAMIEVAKGPRTEAEARKSAALTRGGAMAGVRAGTTETGAEFAARMAGIVPDTSPLTLGPEEAATKQRLKELAKENEKADADLIAKKKALEEGLAKAAESARKLAFGLISGAPGGPTTKFLGLESLPAARSLGMGAMVGAQNYDFGVDAQGFVTFGNAAEEAGKKATKTAVETVTWSDRLGSLADQLQTLAMTTGGLTGKIVGFAASLASGLGGAIQGFQQMTAKGGPGGLLGILGKASGALGIVGSAVGVVGGLISGIKSLFGGKSKEQKAAEEAAKQAKIQAERDARIQKQRDLEAGLGSAKTSAESLMARLAEGGLSEGLTKALQTIIGKIGDALLKSGLGILDPRLTGSKEFGAAQGLAGDVAGGLAGMRQAGIVDAGLAAAGGAAAAEIQKQAVAAALAAGMTPEEAAKAGSAAIAPLLREQLNASITSGKELDENTKALLEEAKKNGIEILADPALQQLDVAKEQLAVLKEIAGRGGNAYGAAGGLGPMITRNMGGGLGPLIQTHPGELVWVLPKAMQRGGMISAARGIYDEGDRDNGRERGGRTGGRDGGAEGADGPAADAPSIVAEVVAKLGPILAQARPVNVNTTIAPIYNEDPTSSKERREDLRRFEHENLRRILRSRDPETVYLMRRALDMG